eukprot:6762439-Ditylum_brightwellii.AAC.1
MDRSLLQQKTLTQGTGNANQPIQNYRGKDQATQHGKMTRTSKPQRKKRKQPTVQDENDERDLIDDVIGKLNEKGPLNKQEIMDKLITLKSRFSVIVGSWDKSSQLSSLSELTSKGADDSSLSNVSDAVSSLSSDVSASKAVQKEVDPFPFVKIEGEQLVDVSPHFPKETRVTVIKQKAPSQDNNMVVDTESRTWRIYVKS